MTDQTAATWTVADDPYGEPTLFHGDTSVFRESDFAVAGAEYRDQLWSTLTRVLAPDEATVERLARAGAKGEGLNWDRLVPSAKPHFLDNVRAVLAALADTAAPHERDGEVGEQ